MAGRRSSIGLTMHWPDGPANGDVRIGAAAPVVDEAWAHFLGRVPWRYFVTLTFNPRKVATIRKIVAGKEVQAWISLVERMMRRPVGWLYALERDRSGRWHGHVLLTDDVRKRAVRAANAVWTERNGRTHYKVVWEGHGAVLYATKDSRRDGEIVPSHQLHHYFGRLRDAIAVRLAPDDVLPVGQTA